MSSKTSRHNSRSSKASPSPSLKKTKASGKDADWADVTDPEERRRIQNRIAQRKFREKARENKEKSERDSRNLEHAGNSYRTPTSVDFMGDVKLSGLPWGSMNLGHVVTKGLEAESKRSSGHNTYAGDDSSNPSSNNYSLSPCVQGISQPVNYVYSSLEDQVMEEPPLLYAIGSPSLPSFLVQ